MNNINKSGASILTRVKAPNLLKILIMNLLGFILENTSTRFALEGNLLVDGQDVPSTIFFSRKGFVAKETDWLCWLLKKNIRNWV